ncbi:MULTISPECIES: hypothetical protein [unclassified Sutcliffiella]|uniref:hypothetical protein n=1 Tax=unclassified Sutcliffiella TaxID=2837532 RepID=UPI0030D1B0E8
MNQNQRKDLNDTGKNLAIETILTVGSDTAADIAKESLTGIVGEILIETGS